MTTNDTKNTARLTYLLPITIDAQPETAAVERAEELDYANAQASVIVESSLLADLDAAYDNGDLPDSLSWGTPVRADLPAGWRWLANGAETVTFALLSSYRSVKVVDGALHQIGHGDDDIPIQVFAAVLARFCSGYQGGVDTAG